VVTMDDGDVATVWAVGVGVLGMDGAGAHSGFLSLACSIASSAMWMTW
jgi:hypothetical protein